MSKTISLLSALLCTFIWGTTFIAQDTGMDDIGPFTFNAVRFFVGFLAVGTGEKLMPSCISIESAIGRTKAKSKSMSFSSNLAGTSVPSFMRMRTSVYLTCTDAPGLRRRERMLEVGSTVLRDRTVSPSLEITVPSASSFCSWAGILLPPVLTSTP